MSSTSSYTGSCFCGAVAFTVTGEPAGMGYCHCESCRRWSAGPVNAFTLWSLSTVVRKRCFLAFRTRSRVTTNCKSFEPCRY